MWQSGLWTWQMAAHVLCLPGLHYVWQVPSRHSAQPWLCILCTLSHLRRIRFVDPGSPLCPTGCRRWVLAGNGSWGYLGVALQFPLV